MNIAMRQTVQTFIEESLSLNLELLEMVDIDRVSSAGCRGSSGSFFTIGDMKPALMLRCTDETGAVWGGWTGGSVFRGLSNVALAGASLFLGEVFDAVAGDSIPIDVVSAGGI